MNPKKIDIEQKRMELFCENRGWTFASIKYNKKNSKQFLVECLDETGMPVFILIGSAGKLWKWIGPKKWEAIEFVSEKEDSK